MVEKAGRRRVDAGPRGDPEPEWEVFVREDEPEPLRHVGSVRAPSADLAHEQATRLFGWYASDIWLCRAEAVRRYATGTLAGDDPAPPGSGDEPRTVER